MIGAIEYGFDITESKKAESALRESEERFRLLSDVTMEGILIHEQGVTHDLNQSLSKLLGYEPDELIGKNILELCVYEDDKKLVRENIVKEYAKPYVVRAIKKNGEIFFAEVEARNIKTKMGYLRVTAVRDITLRIQTENALLESEKRYQSIFMNSPVGLFRSTFDGRFIDVNPALANMLGYNSPEEVIRNIYNIGEQIYVHSEKRGKHRLRSNIDR